MASLSDRITLSVPTVLITGELVEEVVAYTGRAERRKGLPPARVAVYFVLASILFYEDVVWKLAQGLSGLAIWKREWRVPASSARRPAGGSAASRRVSCSNGSPSRARSCLRSPRGCAEPLAPADGGHAAI